MRTMRGIMILTGCLLLTAPLGAQEPVERLERLRMERMQEALRLDAEQAAFVEETLAETRRVQREAATREREAFQKLRSALRDEPVDQEAVRSALETIERERESLVQVRREQNERLSQRLTPEQRARLMLFNRSFETRLRQIMAHRRGGSGGRPGPALRAPGPRRPGPPPGDRGP